jgi:predicted negative regulator of RcsB-dependent stress response
MILFFKALAKGAIGDAYSQKNQPQEALENYVKRLSLIKMILQHHVFY